jgi:hypothetical protein
VADITRAVARADFAATILPLFDRRALRISLKAKSLLFPFISFSESDELSKLSMYFRILQQNSSGLRMPPGASRHATSNR